MNYFNFFENVRKQKKALNIPLISGILVGLVLVVMLCSYLSLRGQLNYAQKDLAYLKQIQRADGFRKQYSQAEALQKDLTRAEQDLTFLGTVDYAAENGTTVSRELVETIVACFGRNAKVIKLTVSGSEISIEGLARNLQTLIDVETNLNAEGSFCDVFISSAKEDTHPDENGSQAVTFSCKMKLVQKAEEDEQ